jgi:hypothetical protein
MAQVVGEASGAKIPILAKGHGTVPAIVAINDDQTQNAGVGLRARSRAAGVIGESTSWIGVIGESTSWMGVFGQTQSTTGGHGVMGRATGGGAGVAGESTTKGVVGFSTRTDFHDPPGVGVHGISTASSRGIGVLGEGGRTGVNGKSNGGHGVTAESVGSPSALLVENHGDFSAVLIFQSGSGRFITCRRPNNNDVFIVMNNGDAKVRGVALTCDRNAKANLTRIDTQQILEKLACLPIQDWNYKADPASVRHIGPTSQDFRAAFGLNGDDDIYISAVDAQGIALAAIQGLNEKRLYATKRGERPRSLAVR